MNRTLNNQELKLKACAAIERKKKELIGVAREILSHPEAGFRETKTSSLVARKFAELRIHHRPGLAITGVKGRITGGAGPGPRVAILGELDSLIVDGHPFSDQSTSASRSTTGPAPPTWATLAT